MSAGNKYKNEVMESLLDKLKSYGLKQVHLDLWEPYQGKDADANSKMFDVSFSNAIIKLVESRKFTPLEAVLEVKQLKPGEVNVLSNLIELGMNGQFIREHRNQYELTHPNFISTLRYLIKSEKLSLQDALHEINTLDAHERYVLTKFYAKGLRGNLLRALRASEHGAQFAGLFKTMVQDSQAKLKDSADYLISVIKSDISKGATWQAAFDDAVTEARMLLNIHAFAHGQDRLNFLNRHAKDGVRSKDVPVIYSEDKQKAYRVLRWVHRLSVQDALAQLKDLSNDQVLLLRKYFKAGLNHDVLSSYPHSYEVTTSLMKTFNWKPIVAVQHLSRLSIAQGRYFHDFAQHGLTLDQAGKLNVDVYSSIKKDVVLAMVEWGCHFHETLQKVMSMTDEQAQAMLKHTVSAPRAVSIKI